MTMWPNNMQFLVLMAGSAAPLESSNAQAGCVPEVQNCPLILWMRYLLLISSEIFTDLHFDLQSSPI